MTPDIAPASARRPSDVLEAAADLIEPEGAWLQGYWCSTKGKCWCAEGAIVVAAGLLRFDNAYRAPAWKILQRHLDGQNIVQWNDTPGRTQTEVVAGLRKAAALARSEGQ